MSWGKSPCLATDCGRPLRTPLHHLPTLALSFPCLCQVLPAPGPLHLLSQTLPWVFILQASAFIPHRRVSPYSGKEEPSHSSLACFIVSAHYQLPQWKVSSMKPRASLVPSSPAVPGTQKVPDSICYVPGIVPSSLHGSFHATLVPKCE